VPVSTEGTLLDGRYRVLRHLGSGGMASVLLCRDERLGRQVAVKRLHADSPADVERRFLREARLGASLNHPNLVSVFDTATDDEGVLIVMEYVDGEALSRALKRGPLKPARVAAMMRDLGSALDHAHSHGVVHRDVKPGNVLLRRDGVTKLVDLGIATASDQTQITHSGMVLGTASYMAPEQLEGGKTEPATDIYSLAVVAYEALTGKRARPGRTPMQIAHQIATGPPPDLRDDLPNVSSRAAEVLKRAMARDPAQRPASAGQLAAELARSLAEPSRGAARRGPRRPAAVAVPAVGTGAKPAAKPEPVAKPEREPDAKPEREPDAPTGPAAAPPPHGRRPGRRHGGSPRRRPVGAIALALVILALAAATVIGAVVTGGGDDGGESQSADRREQPAKAKKKKEKSKSDRQAEQEQPAQPTPAAPQEPAEEQPAEEQPAEEQPAEEPATSGFDPSRGAELNDQGFALMQQGDYAGAVPILQEAVSLFPEDSRDINYAYTLFNLGKALNRSGRPDEAIPYLEKRLTFDDQRGTVQAELDLARKNAGQG
jgi:eukaryotic-like serine/threonine-protein kinase